MLTYSTKLMYSSPPTDVYAIPNPNVSSKGGMTAHDQAVSDNAIMRNVTVCQKNVFGTDYGFVRRVRSHVSGDVLPKYVVISDLQTGISNLVLQVMPLRRLAVMTDLAEIKTTLHPNEVPKASHTRNPLFSPSS